MRAFASAFLMSVAVLASCSEQQTALHYKWSRGDSKDSKVELPASLQKALSDEANLKHLTSNSEHIYQSQQSVGNITIKNSWIQLVKNKNGEIEHINALWYPDLNHEIILKMENITKRAPEIVSYLKRGHKGLRYASQIFPTEVEVATNMLGNPTPHLVITYVNQNETDVVQLRTSGSGRLISETSVATHLTDGLADVYPSAPDQSELTEVTFANLVGNGTLTTTNLKISSYLPEKAYSSEHRFKFSPKIQYFNEVQSFFFADQAITWFSETLGIDLPFQLNIKNHIGGNKPTNAAFYYKGNIRLGDGDGKVFQNIPRDPTIISHEVGHAYIDLIARLPFEGEGGSINEAFADFFTALRLNSAQMAEYSYLRAPYKRTLENNLRADTDLRGKLYADSLIVSGTLWDLKKQLGPELAGDLAIMTLSRLSPISGFADFLSALQDASTDTLTVDERASFNEVLRRRGWMDWSL